MIGVIAFFISGLMRVGVDSLRPVKDATGAQVIRPDGRMLLERDLWGDIKINWLSDVMLLICATAFIWCFVRFVRSRIGNHHVS